MLPERRTILIGVNRRFYPRIRKMAEAVAPTAGSVATNQRSATACAFLSARASAEEAACVIVLIVVLVMGLSVFGCAPHRPVGAPAQPATTAGQLNDLRQWRSAGEPVPVSPISHNRDGSMKLGTGTAWGTNQANWRNYANQN